MLAPHSSCRTVGRLIWLLLGLGAFGTLLVLLDRLALRPKIDRMVQAARRLAGSDLSLPAPEGRAGELGGLGAALNQVGQSLGERLGRIRGVAEAVARVAELVSRTASSVSNGSAGILAQVEESDGQKRALLDSLRRAGEHVESLGETAEQSGRSLRQMTSENEEIARNVERLAASVAETSSAIGEVARSIREVARAVDALRGSAEETSSSISQMDLAVVQVESHAGETARLSEQVSQDAATGVVALQKTLAGIERMRGTSREALRVIEGLGRRTSEIGNVLNVIDDVAEQTNLLALNAAIIAAQAGEHGKGFAVVAEEIKDLAERTGASTKEIAGLISAVQEEGRNALAAVDQGYRTVEQGVELGREAESALKKISASADRSTLMVKAIARASAEQTRGSRQVTTAVQRIAESVQQISEATSDQARRSEQILESAGKMQRFTALLQKSSEDQATGTRQLTRGLAAIAEAAGQLGEAQRAQTGGSQSVVAAVEAIRGLGEQQLHGSRQLSEALELLEKQGEMLRAEVRRFKV